MTEMYTLNEKIRGFEPYIPDCGEYSIKADANESFIPLPASLRMKASRAVLDIEFNRYPDPTAAAVCKAFAAYHNIPFWQVTAGNGSDELISVIVSAFLQKGDTLVTFAPDFSMYRFYGTLCEADCVTIEKHGDFAIDIDEAVKAAKDANAKMLIFSNPCNPTGRGMTHKDVERLAFSLPDTLIVADEAYMEFYNESVLDIVGEYDNLIVLKTCSKAFGLASVRLGFAVACKKLTDVLKAVKSPYNVNAVTQAIAAVILGHRRYADTAIAKIISSRNKLYKELSALSKKHKTLYVYPTNANFVLVKTEKAAFIHGDLCKKGISVRLLGSEYLRITAVYPEENKRIVAEIDAILQ